MAETKIDLKPCPFCKSKHTEQHEYSLSHRPWWLCRECGKVWDDKGEQDNEEGDNGTLG